jgi:MarR family transcriptional regulator for hemolysin
MEDPLNTEDPHRSLGFLLHDCMRLMRRQFLANIQDLGLTLAQAQVLAHLSRRLGVTQAMLAEQLEIQPISVARLVDKLVEHGWIERRPHLTDRRAVRLYLTDAAQPILKTLWARASKVRAAALAGLTEAQREAMIEGLLQMKRNLAEKETSSDEKVA